MIRDIVPQKMAHLDVLGGLPDARERQPARISDTPPATSSGTLTIATRNSASG